jgi:hypothetical protein
MGRALAEAGTFVFIVGCAIPGCVLAWASYVRGLWGPLTQAFWSPYGVYVPPLIGMVLGALVGWLVSRRWAVSPAPAAAALVGVLCFTAGA